MRSFLSCCIFCLFGATASAQQAKFQLPLKGIPGKDYFICYYQDHDSSVGARDAYCGTKVYDGHTGTDLIIRNFKTMDSGVYVYAADDGVVLATEDGNYDRQKKWVPGARANYIEVMHLSGYSSYYFHLKTGSQLVKTGDHVSVGQPIALVGSSGRSNQPHLHFEVRNRSSKPIDPFTGNCQTDDGLWATEVPYDTSFIMIDKGFIPYIPNLDTLQERYLVRDSFFMDEDSLVCFWVQAHGFRPGMKTRFEWYTPQGKLYHSFDYLWHHIWWLDYTWGYIRMPKIKGKWRVKYFVDGKLMSNASFHLKKRRS